MKCWNIFSGHAGQYWNMIYPNDGEITDTEAKKYLSEITCGNNRDFNTAITYRDDKVVISSISRYFSAGVAMETKHIIIGQIDKNSIEDNYSNILSFGFVPSQVISNLYNNPGMMQQAAVGIPDTAENFGDVEVNPEALNELVYALVEKIRLGEDRPIYIAMPSLNVQEYIHYCKAVVNRIMSVLPVGLRTKASFSIFPSQKDSEYSIVFADERELGAGGGFFRIDKPVNLKMENQTVRYMVETFVKNPNFYEAMEDRYDISELTVSKYIDFLMLYIWKNSTSVDINLLKQWDDKLKKAQSLDTYYAAALEDAIGACISKCGITSDQLSVQFMDENVKTFEDLNNMLAPYVHVLGYLAGKSLCLSQSLLENYYNRILAIAERMYGSGNEYYENVYSDFLENKSNIEKCFSGDIVRRVELFLENKKNQAKSQEIMSNVKNDMFYCRTLSEVIETLAAKRAMYQEIDIRLDKMDVEELLRSLVMSRTESGDWAQGSEALVEYDISKGGLKEYMSDDTYDEIEELMAGCRAHFYQRCCDEGLANARKSATSSAFLGILARCGSIREIDPKFTVADNILYDYIVPMCSGADFMKGTYELIMDLLDKIQCNIDTYGVDARAVEMVRNEVEARYQQMKAQTNVSQFSLKTNDGQQGAQYTDYNAYGNDNVLRGNENASSQNQNEAPSLAERRRKAELEAAERKKKKIIKIAIIAGIVVAVIGIGALVGFLLGRDSSKNSDNGKKTATETDADNKDDKMTSKTEDTTAVTTEDTTDVTTEATTEASTETTTEAATKATIDVTTETTTEKGASEQTSQEKGDGKGDEITSGGSDVDVQREFSRIKMNSTIEQIISKMSGPDISQSDYSIYEKYLVIGCIVYDASFKQDDTVKAAYIRCNPEFAKKLGVDDAYVDTYPLIAVQKDNAKKMSVYYYDGNLYKKVESSKLKGVDVNSEMKNGQTVNSNFNESLDTEDLNQILKDNYSGLEAIFHDV